MDIDQVNDVLSRANTEFERRELEDLRAYEIEGELEIGDAPSAEDLDRIEAESNRDQGNLDEQDEPYVGIGGTEPPDYSPPGDPIVGSDQGVDNLASDAEAYMSFVAECATNIAATCGVSDDEALSAFEDVAAQLASVGSLPSMPDIESATSDAISEWTGKAKTSDLVARVIEYVKAGKGQSPLHVVVGR